VACCDDHVLARHLDAFAFPFARTVSLHVNADRLHEVGLVLARDLAYVVVLHLDAVGADVFDAEAVGLTAQLGDYLAFGLLLRLHTTHLRMRERPLFERLYLLFEKPVQRPAMPISEQLKIQLVYKPGAQARGIVVVNRRTSASGSRTYRRRKYQTVAREAPSNFVADLQRLRNWPSMRCSLWRRASLDKLTHALNCRLLTGSTSDRILCLEYAYNMMDKKTATWLYQIRKPLELQDWYSSPHLPDDPGKGVDLIMHEAVTGRKQHINTFEEMIRPLKRLFHQETFSWHPYHFWDVLSDMRIPNPRIEERLATMVKKLEEFLLGTG